ncbi:MAG: peptidoglycan-binding protein [Candidatus Zambryskibacteria bacterium]|nr:peptidoglycan-binding protein [Candidatus Zambryskibacteria bacterium]
MKKNLLFLYSFLGFIILSPQAFAGSATLSWFANSEPDLAGYKIYYGTSHRAGSCPAGGYSNVADVGKVNTYNFNNLTDGLTYYFSLTAYDTSNNESCFSTEVSKNISIAVPSGDTINPSIPTNLLATVVSYSQIDLSWSASTDNVGVSAYRIYRNGIEINTTENTSYSDTNLTANTSYSYKISAYDTAGNRSEESNSVNATTKTAPISTNTTPVTTNTGSGSTSGSSSGSSSSFSSPSSSSSYTTTYPITTTNTNITTTTSGTGIVLTQTTSIGYEGAEVIKLQEFLVSRGYLTIPPGTDYGYYGELTRTAVEKFQCTEGIICSGNELTTGYGMVGQLTRAAINKYAEGTSISTPVFTTTSANIGGSGVALTKTMGIGYKGTEVAKLQKFLVSKGYLTMPADTSYGYYGSLTRAAVQKFQCEQKIVCSGNELTTGYGMVGQLTRNVINKFTETSSVIPTNNTNQQLLDLIASLLKQVALLQAKLQAMQKAGQ